MTPLLIATTNDGKLREIREVLDGLDVPIHALTDFPPVPEPEETGTTFAANALLKARAYAAATGVDTVAEDSGLVIDALGGAPGVHSARYPGDNYPDKFANLYAALRSHPRPWTARYVCAIAVVQPGPVRHSSEGATAELARRSSGGVPGAKVGRVLFEAMATVEGEIWPEPRGRNGFGYDPIFYYPPYGKTFGEVDDARKLAVAHRGKAFGALRLWIERGRYWGH